MADSNNAPYVLIAHLKYSAGDLAAVAGRLFQHLVDGRAPERSVDLAYEALRVLDGARTAIDAYVEATRPDRPEATK